MTGHKNIVPDRKSLAFFGYDAFESTLRKRIAAFQRSGWQVFGFMFRRRRQEPGPVPAWQNVDLGETADRAYVKRLPALALGALRCVRLIGPARHSDVFYARNIDMLGIAWLVKVIVGAKAPLVYEVLDVQRVFVGNGPVSRGFRAVERFLLRRCALLVVSSPDFIARYFGPVQGYRGEWYLLENKISGSADLPQGADRAPACARTGPWVIGWFGVLRCERSLDMLCDIADRLGSDVRIYIRGRTSETDIPSSRLMAAVERRPNMEFGGAYANPADLAAIYGEVDLSWSIDYTDAGANSDWLLPNRIYEGGYFGSVALAREGTTAGRVVRERQLGWSVPEPLVDNVVALLSTLTRDELRRRREAVLALPRSMFVDEVDTGRLLETVFDLRANAAPFAGRLANE